MIKFKQLALDVCLRDEFTLENFYSSQNEAIASFIQKMPTSLDLNSLYLWGKEASGKTHLLIAACQLFKKNNLSAAYLPLVDHQQFSTDFLENLENLDLLCIDDLEIIIGNQKWEEAIFHCFNRLNMAQKKIIITAKNDPATFNFILPDLKSRLLGSLVLNVHELDKEQKIAAVDLRAKILGLPLSNAAIRFLLTYSNNDLYVLFSTLKYLDQASLLAKSKLSLPFIKLMLGV
jgi:DnaA-homolog protein